MRLIILSLLSMMPLFAAETSLSEKAIDGTAVILPTEDHKPVLLVFWASWCDSCNKEAPILVKLHGELNGRINIIGINVDENVDAAMPFIKKYTLPYPNINDGDLNISEQFAVESTPTLILFDGKMKEVHRAEHLDKAMVQSLRRVLKKMQQQTKRPKTKPLTQVLARSPENVIEQHAAVMGTDIHILIHTRDAAKAEQAIAAGLKEMRRIDDAMTDWRPIGQVAQINKHGDDRPVKVSKELIMLIKEAGRIHALTDGLFDITYRGVGSLWNFYQEPHTIPDADLLQAGLNKVGFQHIVVDEDAGTVFLPVAGMEIGLGGIAKGYAVDRAVAIIAAYGFSDFVVNAGGDLYVKGSKDTSLWRVGVRHPRKNGELLAEIPAKNYAVVTSGDYERFFIKNGKRYCHIINPKTGYPADSSQSVTILAANSMQADALATGIFIMGPERGLKLVESLDSVEALIVGADCSVHMSTGFKQ